MHSLVADIDQTTSTHIYGPKATPTAEYSKEVDLAKSNDEDDARLSEIKEKSESEEKSKKEVGKTTSVKDTIVAAEGMEKVDTKTKEAAYYTKVDDEASLSVEDEKKPQRNIEKIQKLTK